MRDLSFSVELFYDSRTGLALSAYRADIPDIGTFVNSHLPIVALRTA
jgi:hypothetical protein